MFGGKMIRFVAAVVPRIADGIFEIVRVRVEVAFAVANRTGGGSHGPAFAIDPDTFAGNAVERPELKTKPAEANGFSAPVGKAGPDASFRTGFRFYFEIRAEGFGGYPFPVDFNIGPEREINHNNVISLCVM